MYATRLNSQVYHFVLPEYRRTLCGLRVSRVPFSQAQESLHLFAAPSPEQTLCKHCERISKQDQLVN